MVVAVALTCRRHPFRLVSYRRRTSLLRLVVGFVVVVRLGVGVDADLDLGAVVEAVASGGDDHVGRGEAGEDLDVLGVLEAEGYGLLVGGAVGGDDHDNLEVPSVPVWMASAGTVRAFFTVRPVMDGVDGGSGLECWLWGFPRGARPRRWCCRDRVRG